MFALAAYSGAQTLEECLRAAEKNYPLVSQYDLIRQTRLHDLSNIDKEWLPQLSASAQATYQNRVAEWPSGVRSLMSQNGVNIEGLGKDQYKIGVDLTQKIYDGGQSRHQKSVVRLEGEYETAELDISVYAVRQRVIELFFSSLLLEERWQLAKNLLSYMKSNEEKLSSMLNNGTASLSDYNNMKAERISVETQIIDLECQHSTAIQLLQVLCGMEIHTLQKPSWGMMTGANNHPELKAVESQLRLIDAKEKLLDSALLPKVGLFATGYYGYPGYNMFDDMMSNDWSLNGIVGLKVTWNIGALYTRRSDKAKLKLMRNTAESRLDTFLFSNNMEQRQHSANIDRYARVMERDDEVISLRSSVRKAAESRLDHGIIDVSELVRNIKEENDAKVQKAIHETEIMKEEAELRNTLNQ